MFRTTVLKKHFLKKLTVFMLLKMAKSVVSLNLPLHQTDLQKSVFTHLNHTAEKAMPMQLVFTPCMILRKKA